MLDMNSYELINTYSPFVLFDLIRSVGGRGMTGTTEKRLQRINYDYKVYNGNGGYSLCSSTHPTSSNRTTESVKECNDNDTKV